MTMTLIETKTLASSNAVISFTSIPQTYTDLYVTISLRSDTTGNTEGTVALNGSTQTAARRLRGNGATAGSGTNFVLFAPATGNTANTFSNDSIYIPNYTGTTQKSVSTDNTTENNVASSQVAQEINALLYNVTTGVTTLTITDLYGSWITGSTASLYGILKGSGGATVS